MRTLLLGFALLATARAADTPLSAVLIDGQGWLEVSAREGGQGGSPYVCRKDDSGRWGVYLGAKGPLAVAADGESWGATAVSPKGGKLVVAVPSHHHLYAFQIRPDGSLWAREKTYTLRREKIKGGSGVGTLTFDTKGRLWAAMPMGVQFFDEEMRFSGQLSRPTRERVTQVWFKGDELFIEGGGRTWKRKVKAEGVK